MEIIYFTGVPGSRWSGVSQILETTLGFNTSDRNSDRTYTHNIFSGHVGMYFGTGMLMEANKDKDYIADAFGNKDGTVLAKSHEWAHQLDELSKDKIIFVYRPDDISFKWWKKCGGFSIEYPDYTWYENDAVMEKQIKKQNENILKYCHLRDISLVPFNLENVNNMFDSDFSNNDFSNFDYVFIGKNW